MKKKPIHPFLENLQYNYGGYYTQQDYKPPPKKPQRKRLVVRNTRAQNMRKQVAQETLNPVDPPWIAKKKRKQSNAILTISPVLYLVTLH